MPSKVHGDFASRLSALAQAADQRADIQPRDSEGNRWRIIWGACCASLDHILACCSYCARVRGPAGDWGAIPSGLSQALHRRILKAVQLSHGACPDCLARHMPVGGGTPDSPVRRSG
jgi:hypothetical protein